MDPTPLPTENPIVTSTHESALAGEAFVTPRLNTFQNGVFVAAGATIGLWVLVVALYCMFSMEARLRGIGFVFNLYAISPNTKNLNWYLWVWKHLTASRISFGRGN